MERSELPLCAERVGQHPLLAHAPVDVEADCRNPQDGERTAGCGEIVELRRVAGSSGKPSGDRVAAHARFVEHHAEVGERTPNVADQALQLGWPSNGPSSRREVTEVVAGVRSLDQLGSSAVPYRDDRVQDARVGNGGCDGHRWPPVCWWTSIQPGRTPRSHRGAPLTFGHRESSVPNVSRQGGVDFRNLDLAERDDELDALAAAAFAAAAGQGRFLAIRGAAGIGKTRLLDAVGDSHQIRVLRARGLELERDFSFGLVHQLLDELMRRLEPADRAELLSGAASHCGGLFGEATPVVSDDPGFVTTRGLWWLLLALADREPLALVCDDIQWADPASLRVLSFVASRLTDAAILLVAAARGDQSGIDPMVDEVLLAAQQTLVPQPLTAPGTTALLTASLGKSVDPEFATAAQLACRGNPFLLTELAREFVFSGIEPTAREAVVISRMAPDSVSRSVLARLARGGSDVAEVARSVAVLGDDVLISDTAVVAGLDMDRVRRATSWLVESGIFRWSERLAFEHPIVREAVYGGIAPSLRTGLHSRAAETLAGRGVASDQIAIHLLHTEPARQPATVAILREAAQFAAAAGANDVAASYLSRALEEPADGDARPAVLADLARAEVLCGAPGGLDRLREAIAVAIDPTVEVELHSQLAASMLLMGEVDAAMRLADDFGAKLSLRSDSNVSLEARLEVEASMLSAAVIADATTWLAVAPRLELISLADVRSTPAGKPLLALRAFDQLRRGGSVAMANALALEALEDDILLARGPEFLPLMMACFVCFQTGLVDRAIEVLERAVAEAQERGVLAGYAFASCFLGVSRGMRGDSREGLADIEGALVAAREHDWVLIEAQCVAYYLLALTVMGDFEKAEAAMERAGLVGDLPSNSIADGVLQGRAELRLAQGRWEEAYADFMECGRRQGAFQDSPLIWWRSNAAIALARLGRRDEAIELATESLAINTRWGDAGAIGHAERGLGVVLGGDEGIELLQRSVERAEHGNQLDLCRSLLDLGRLLRQNRRRADARRVLQRCLTLVDRMGCVVIADEARAELAAAGGRPRNIVRTGVDSLTPSERRVASLAASGLSNPQIAQRLFVSRKTVEAHLAGCYLKLDISSRSDLPAALG